jgi:hypothetical protein
VVTSVVESNNTMQSKLNEQDEKLNQMEIELQRQRDAAYCMTHIQTNDFEKVWNCFDEIIINPNYYFEPEILEQYYKERDEYFAQKNHNNFANCDLTDIQKMQINSLMTDDSIDPSVAFSQMSMISQSGCN